MEKADYKVLPLALVGVFQGVFRYFIVQPVAEAVQGWIDGHIITQEELDKYIGEVASHDSKDY